MLIAVAAALLLNATPATPPETTAPPAATTWYGYQPLIVDAIAGALIAGGVATSGQGGGLIPLPNPLLGFGVLTYLLGGPIAHALHGRALIGGLDLLIRLGLPISGGLIGEFLVPVDPTTGISPGRPYGSLIGAVAASALDAALWSFAPVAPATATPAGVSLAPFVGASRGALLAGVAGRF
jgi:hypothetical protein